ncbi:hypothetical protein ACFWXH_11920 [Mesorhizobium sp. NPDC059054]|uniref:hypothetical protein n=1 Tax=Mesorhizobium sp. NPDC059054 TaxID=3346711 RepID=UPI0036B6EBEF
MMDDLFALRSATLSPGSNLAPKAAQVQQAPMTFMLRKAEKYDLLDPGYVVIRQTCENPQA